MIIPGWMLLRSEWESWTFQKRRSQTVEDGEPAEAADFGDRELHALDSQLNVWCSKAVALGI